MCLVPTLPSSYPSQGLPIQHISAPGSVPSALVGYLNQNFRDDPFSSVRGSACSQNSEQSAIEGISIRGVSNSIGISGLGLSQAGLPTQYPHFALAFPYTIDTNNAAFTAPRMEAQLSTSTLFDTASTNADLESGDEFMLSEMDMGQGLNEGELAGLIDMSASQLTVHDNHGVPTLQAHLSSFNSSPRALEFTDEPMVTGSLSQPLPADLHLLPELTDTVGTPSSPPQMSRQPSCATGCADGFGSFGMLSQAPGPMDVLTAPEMIREWSDLSNPAINMVDTLSPDGQYQRKRLMQHPPEDIELLLKGTGVATAAPAAYRQYVGVPSVGVWQELAPQLEHLGHDLGGESGADDTYNPAKLRRVDGQDVCDARAHVKSVGAATHQCLNSSPNFPGFNLVPGTGPLPPLDEHFAINKSRSGGGVLSSATQPVTGNTQQVVTAPATTVTTSTIQNTVRSVPGSSPSNPRSNLSSPRQNHNRPRPRVSPSQINMNSRMPSRPYARRINPRVFCDQCDEVRDGFRGDHELRRHKERVHAVNKKVWVTKDISPDGDFLASCKACKRGKHYFADYNVAAHLRRQHFCKVRKRGKSRNERDEMAKSSLEEVHSKLKKWGMDWREKGSDNRGGFSQAGEGFTMKFLRQWMQQIEIPRKADDLKGNNKGSLSGEDDDEYEENDEVLEKDLDSGRIPGKGNKKGVSFSSVTLADIKRNERLPHRSPTESSTNPNTLQEVQPLQTTFQSPLTYGQIDVGLSANLAPDFLPGQIPRELQEFLGPAMDIGLSAESFYR